MYRTAPNASTAHHIMALASSKEAEVDMAHQLASELLEREVAVPLSELQV